jgi:hypothetical protein
LRTAPPFHASHARPFLLVLGGGFVLLLRLVVVDRWLVKPRPTEPQPTEAPPDLRMVTAGAAANRPDRPPWMTVTTLEGLLRDEAPGLHVVRPEPSAGYCCVCDGDAFVSGVPTAE